MYSLGVVDADLGGERHPRKLGNVGGMEQEQPQALVVVVSEPRQVQIVVAGHGAALQQQPGNERAGRTGDRAAQRGPAAVPARLAGAARALSYRFKCRSGSGRSVRADAAETVSRIGPPPKDLHRAGYTGRSCVGMASQIPVEGSAYGTATVAGLSRHFACGCGYRHGRSGSCRAAATASARARCAWQRVIDCCTVMRSCATDHRSRASGRVISIPGSRRSSSSDSEIERV